jgi:peptidoglycan/xylan/chitin deacetylase (PgdA/CDA1 family)
VLVYHHVREPGRSAPSLTVRPERFAEQMTLLRETRVLIGLDDLLAQLRHGRAPRGARVLLTLDDAALDTYDTALPILNDLGIPATVFVPTGCIGRGAFWWNRTYLLSERARARGLNLSAFLDAAGVPEPTGGWGNNALRSALRGLADRERDELLAAAQEWLGTDCGDAAGAMNWDQLAHMSADGLITVGGHSVSHAVLAGLEETRLAFEVTGSREALAGLRSFRPVFAYPYGDVSAVDSAAVRAVHQANFEAAFTTTESAITGDEAPLLLGRYCVADLESVEFSQKIDDILSSN